MPGIWCTASSLTTVPYAWLLYVNGKLVRHNRRWTAAVCHVMTGTAIAVVLLTVIIPLSPSTRKDGVHAVPHSLNHGSLPAKLVNLIWGLILTATADPKEVTKEGQKETRYLLEAGVFSLVGGIVQSFAESWRTGGTFCGTGSAVYLSECAEPADHDLQAG